MRLFQALQQRGFSLIELTVALAIFSAGLGSFSLLLLMAIQGTLESRLHSIAASQIYSLSESISMTPAAGFDFSGTSTAPACLLGAVCTPAQMAAATLAQWQKQLAGQIPGGQGVVCKDSTPGDGSVQDAACDGTGDRVVKVFWTEPGGPGVDIQDRRVYARLPLL